MNINLQSAKEACRKISDELLPGIEDILFPWAENKEKIYNTFNKEISRFEVAEEMPEELIIYWSNQFVAGKVFTSSDKLEKFLNQNSNFLNQQEKELIKYFIGNQWFYSVFSIEEVLEKNIIRIYDYSQKKSLVLCSKSVFELYRNGSKLFLCLLFFNGECYQTYGVINFFKGYTPYDFHYFARNASHHFKQDGNLSNSILRNPIPFMLLCRFSEISYTRDKDGLIEICHHSLTVENFNPEEYSSVFEFQEKNKVLKGTPKEEQPGEIINLYYEQKNQTLHLFSNSYNRYLSILKIVSKKITFPNEPLLRISPLMGMATERILGIKPSILKLSKIFEERSGVESDHRLSKLNAAAVDLVQNYAEGKSSSFEEFQKKYGLTKEEVMLLKNDFEKIAEKFHIDIHGGLEDFVPPTPVQRRVFNQSFQKNDLFRFNNNATALGYLRVKLPGLRKAIKDLKYETLSLNELPDFIEDLFFNYWGNDTGTILLYTIYLLSKKGQNFICVRDYAIEFLRIFWQIILPSKEDKFIEEFIKNYGYFCFDVLYRVGLIEVEPTLNDEESQQARYKIKASPFFFEWIKFHQAH